MMIPRIAYVGDLTSDVYTVQKLEKLGGAALNSAIWAKRLGAEASVFSAVGDDNTGKQFVRMLARQHIDASHVELLPGDTSSIEISVGKNGERTYGTWDPGTLREYHLSHESGRAIGKYDAVCVTVYPQYVHILAELRRIKPKANARKKPFVVVNFGDMKEFQDDIAQVTDSMAGADMLVFGLDKDRDEVLINSLKDAVSEETLLLVTLGLYGSVAWHKGKCFVHPAMPVKVKDTTGAGDAFLTAFLVSYLKNKDIPSALRSGTGLASNVIGQVGAY